MRTTLDIAEDVLLAVKERARRERRTAGQVLTDLAREALVRPPRSNIVAEPESFYGFEPIPSRGTVVSNDLIDQLRDQEGI